MASYTLQNSIVVWPLVSFTASDSTIPGASQGIVVNLPNGGGLTWTVGTTGNHQASAFWLQSFTLINNTTINLTGLTGGAGANSFSNINGFLIVNSSASANTTLTVGNATTNSFPFDMSSNTTTFVIDGSGGFEFWASPKISGILTANQNTVFMTFGGNTQGNATVLFLGD